MYWLYGHGGCTYVQRLKVSSVDFISKSCLLPEFCCKTRNPRSSWFTHFKFRARKDGERSTTTTLSVCPQQAISTEFFFQLLLSIQTKEEKPFCALPSPNTNFSQKITNREDNDNDQRMHKKHSYFLQCVNIYVLSIDQLLSCHNNNL